MDEELGGLTEDDFVLPPVKYECKLLRLYNYLKTTIIVDENTCIFNKFLAYLLYFCSFLDLDHTADVQ